jgi:MarR family transcriptional regulator, transcriptional regulator for hemolysin
MTTKRPPFATGFLIHDVSRIRTKVVDNAIKPLGITRSQFWVLVNIARYADGAGIIQTDLARLMDAGKVPLGGLIDRMEANGLLTRKPCEEDRRAKRVMITPKGQKLLEDMQGIAKEINKKIMKGISRQENDQLDDLLKKMKKNLISLDRQSN